MTYSISQKVATLVLMCAIFASFFAWSPAANAQFTSTPANSALITKLQALIVELQAKLATLGGTPASKPSSSQIVVGDKVVTLSALRVRETPSTTGTVVATVGYNVQGTVVEVPLGATADGYTWYKVAYDTGKTGWSAGMWLKEVAQSDADASLSCESFYFTPSTVVAGQSTTVTWKTTSNGDVQLRSSVGDFDEDFDAQGSYSFIPEETSKYVLTGVAQDGSAISCVATIIVQDAATVTDKTPICDYAYFTPAAVREGEPTTMKWKTTNANKVVLTSTVGDVNKEFGTSGTYTFTPLDSAKYAITAFGSDGSKTTCVTTVIVDEDLKEDAEEAKAAKCDYFTFTPSTIKAGESSLMSWKTTNGVRAISTSSIAIFNNFDFPLNGTYQLAPQFKTTDNSLTVYGAGAGNTDSCEARLTVTPR